MWSSTLKRFALPREFGLKLRDGRTLDSASRRSMRETEPGASSTSGSLPSLVPKEPWPKSSTPVDQLGEHAFFESSQGCEWRKGLAWRYTRRFTAVRENVIATKTRSQYRPCAADWHASWEGLMSGSDGIHGLSSAMDVLSGTEWRS